MNGRRCATRTTSAAETRKCVRPAPRKLDITRDTKAFTAAIRNRVFTFLRGLVIGDYEQALGHARLSAQAARWRLDARARLRAGHGGLTTWMHEQLCLDPNARNVRHTYVTPSEDKRNWRVQQMLVDPEEHNDWVAEFEVDLIRICARNRETRAVLLKRFGPLVR